MVIEEEFSVNVPVNKAWDFLIDGISVAGCLPGCTQVEAPAENYYRAHMQLKLGPIKVRFKMQIDITELHPPTSVKTFFQGEDSGMASKVRAHNVVGFTEQEPGKTTVHYRSEVTIVGRLAKFGEGVVRRKAKELGEEFARAVKLKLEQGIEPVGLQAEEAQLHSEDQDHEVSNEQL